MIRTLLIAALVLAAGCNDSREDPAAQDAAAQDAPDSAQILAAARTVSARTISAADMRAVVAELSSDAYGGRDPGTDGDVKARRYLAERLEALGYAPGAGAGYQQPFDLVGMTATQPGTWTFRHGEETQAFEQGDDFIVASGVQSDSAAIDDAELVFVGYGIEAPEYQWDDFGDADLRGKVLVMLNNDPDWDPELFDGEGRLYYGRWTYKYESAARQGATGAIIIHTAASAGYPWQVVDTSFSGTQFELAQGDEPRLPPAPWLNGPATT
jgi:hypothetical protein